MGKRNICICGGGNLGHVIGGYVASKEGYSVSILTGHPDCWGSSLRIELPNGSSVVGSLNAISGSAGEVIPQADIVIVCLPGMYIRKELEAIKPFLRKDTVVGTVVSSTGFFFQAHDVIPYHSLFGFQRVPYISRIIEYGHSASLLGFKKSLNVCIENISNPRDLCEMLSDMFDTPVELLDSSYEVTLSNSNPLLHTSRLYSMWKGYKPGVVYPSIPMFFEDWTIEASQLYIDMDNEFQLLLETLPVKEGSILPVLKYYESSDAASLTSKISSIEAFKSIKSPMIEVEGGWIPDLNSRYFTEDFNYGLKYIWELAHAKQLDVPNIDLVYSWGRSIVK